MASKFLSWLENIPAELKKLFTNPVVDSTITGALGVASLIDPALAPMLNGIAAAVAKAEALAAAANVQTGSGAQKLALATADAQATFQAYETATGVQIESAQQVAIINSIVAILNNIPTTTVASVSAGQATLASLNAAVLEPMPAKPAVKDSNLL